MIGDGKTHFSDPACHGCTLKANLLRQKLLQAYCLDANGNCSVAARLVQANIVMCKGHGSAIYLPKSRQFFIQQNKTHLPLLQLLAA